MTGDETLKKLEELFIITKVGDSYYITEKYKTLPEKLEFIELKAKEQEPLSNKEMIQAIQVPTEWHETIISSIGRSRVVAFMDVCNIPSITAKRYRLRGFDKEVVKAIDKIVKDRSIKPIPFIESVKRYYATMEMPKGFKKYILEGDAMEVYEEFIELRPREGDATFIDPINKPNSTWG